jgi:hypothetical protein
MRIKSSRAVAREGQGSRLSPRQKLPLAPKVAPVAVPRPPRDWAAQDAKLVAAGTLTVFVDMDAVSGRRKGAGAGRGCPYPDTAVQMVVASAVLFKLPLRQAEGFGSMLWGLLGLAGRSPDYTTISRRRRTLELDWPEPSPGGHTLIVDGTGVRLDGGHGWAEDKPGAKKGDRRRRKYLKLHLGIDAATGEMLAAIITESAGTGSGDVSVGPELIDEAAGFLQRCVTPAWLVGGIGDGAYDSVSCYHRMRVKGRGPWVAPPASDAVRGRDPARDRHLAAIARRGLVAWKKEVGYHQRSLVESANHSLKTTVGLASRCRNFESQAAEIATQLWVWATLQTKFQLR